MPVEKLIAGCKPPLGGYDADIIILSLDRPDETCEAIRSALSQRGGMFHVTVLDQGSAPETVRGMARNFGSSPHFALYQSPENLGVAGGRNLATALGHGQFIIALDNDAVFQGPYVAANAVRAFHRQPDLGALGFAILSADGVTPDRSSWGYPTRLISRHRERFETTTFVGAGHAIRRAAWNAAGGYDPDFFFTWEEYDFCLRALALGWRIRYDGSLAVIHKVLPQARLSWSDARMRHYIRNRLIIARKWGENLAPRLLGYIIKAARNRQLGSTLAGIREARAAELLSARKMPKAMREYIYRNETRHRGSWADRLRFELLNRANQAPPAGDAPAPAAAIAPPEHAYKSG